MAWITVANSLTVSAQMALPDWVRARGMSIYQMALMGASAPAPRSGARWPTSARPDSLGIAAASGVLSMLVAQRYVDRRTATRKT